ncbi:unnamed protein product, partial [Rotaria socialis]
IDCVHNKIELMIFNMRSNRYIEYEIKSIVFIIRSN